MMATISRESLLSLEQYVMAHKQKRKIHLGENVTLIFEDELTMRYQVQEMLRAERIFEEEGILDELNAYNPLIPDGSNWKATMMIEYPDADERKRALSRLIGIEDRVFVQVEGHEKVFAISDEDLERENEQKTSSVHFLRFELTKAMKDALKHSAALSVGVDHANYRFAIERLPEATRQSLINDLRL
jgi:uncharacterized protein YggL (DUF469 family)